MLAFIKRSCGYIDTQPLAFHCEVKEDYDIHLDVIKRAFKLDLKVDVVCLEYNDLLRTYVVMWETGSARDVAERMMMKLVRLVGVKDCTVQMPWGIWVRQHKGNCRECWNPPSTDPLVSAVTTDVDDWRVTGSNLVEAKVYLGFDLEDGNVDTVLQFPKASVTGSTHTQTQVTGYIFDRQAEQKSCSPVFSSHFNNSPNSKVQRPNWLYIVAKPIRNAKTITEHDSTGIDEDKGLGREYSDNQQYLKFSMHKVS